MDLQHTFSSDSCRSSTVDHDEEMTLESLTKRHEVQEVMKESGRGNGDAGDQSRCGRGLKASTWTFMVKASMNGGTLNFRSLSQMPGEEGEEMKSPKRKNRVESEDSEDYVREAKDTDQKENGRTEFRTECDQ